MSNKPVVLYKDSQRIEMGRSAIVTPLNHPSELVTNTMPVMTSQVIALLDGGGFETLNTIYKEED